MTIPTQYMPLSNSGPLKVRDVGCIQGLEGMHVTYRNATAAGIADLYTDMHSQTGWEGEQPAHNTNSNNALQILLMCSHVEPTKEQACNVGKVIADQKQAVLFPVCTYGCVSYIFDEKTCPVGYAWTRAPLPAASARIFPISEHPTCLMPADMRSAVR